jgi:3-deoxy-D-arabino-heptulosonate 7-phosphate (DAHP) synthase
MFGLNISRPIEFVFGNFHDKRPQSQDYKIRYAFKDTNFYGAYMTDIIKDFENVISGDVMKYLKKNPDFEKKNVEMFRKELKDIGSQNHILIAFGNHAQSLLVKHFSREFKVIKFPHYSMQISKEEYKTIIDKLTKEFENR